MEPRRDRLTRTTALGGSLCLVAVLVILVAGASRADAAVHHRSPAATATWAAGDNHGAMLRLDQPVGLTAAAVLLLAGMLLLRARTSAPSPSRFTAHTPAPRGPPRQAR